MTTRRQFIIASSLLGIGSWGKNSYSTPEEAVKLLETITGNKTWATERVKLTIPQITEQWQFIPVSVEVEGPWLNDHNVREIHLIAERNPKPHIVSFNLTPECWPPRITTRLRLIKTQIVIAAAVLNDNRVLIGKEICKVVTPGKGCG